MDFVYVVVMLTEKDTDLLKVFKSKRDARKFCVQTFLDNSSMTTPADIRNGYTTWDGSEIDFSVEDSYLILSSIKMNLE